jgi:glycogen operon protein
VGNFPVLWAEWNGLYRDTVRDFWRGAASVAQFASRFTGSSDLYGDDGRLPFASINFVTAHDGFTLRDLVSYNEKHNEANGEENHDGSDDNRSWNHGAEGPMLLGGDEIGRTQHGNNNAWCQDNEVSWFDWENADGELHAFTRRLIRFRREHPVFRRKTFLTGHEVRDSGLPDVWWFRPDGRRMTQKDWQRQDLRTLGAFLNGEEIPSRTPDGREIVDSSFLLLFNAEPVAVTFTLPTRRFGARWEPEVATGAGAPEAVVPARAQVNVDGRSLVVLRRQ